MSTVLTKVRTVSVSVVIPCYCCEDTIERALDSIGRQSYLPHEVILVEDGSPDDGKTLDRLLFVKKKYESKFVINVISLETNQGAAAARNRGWNVSSQPYIAFLDSDDAWHPNKLEYQYNYMASHPMVALAGHGCRICESSFDSAIIGELPKIKKIAPLSLLLSNSLPTPSVMLRSDIPYRFREGQRYVDDHLLWLEIVLSGLPAVRLDAPLAFVFKAMYGASGLSSNMWAMEKAELGNYWRLYKNQRIALILTIGLTTYSLVKYFRRLMIVSFRRWSRNA